MVIFDKTSESVSMLYTNPKLDKSDDVLTMMGYKAGPKPAAGTGAKPAGGTPANTTGGNKPVDNKFGQDAKEPIEPKK
jgi:hypothetical protein